MAPLNRSRYYSRFSGGGCRVDILRNPFIELRKILPKRRLEVQVIRDALDKYVVEVPSEAARATYGGEHFVAQ